MGSTSYYTQQDGSVYDSHVYDVWGSVQWSSGHGVNDGKTAVIEPNYTGHNYDPVLEIYFAEARFYDAKNRQWMASDPIKSGLNWYGYVGANPTTYFDPNGLELVLLQHGINASFDTWGESVKAFEDAGYLDLGTITLREHDVKTNKDREDIKIQLQRVLSTLYKETTNEGFRVTNLSTAELSSRIKEEITKRSVAGEKMLIRTEFSNPIGGNMEQRDELGTMLDYLTYKDEKVSLVGHSKGGIVSSYYALFAPCKIDTLVTVNSPFALNE